MNEYFFEDGAQVDTQRLQTGYVSADDYEIAHQTIAFACHDVVVEKDGRYLFVERTVKPALGALWPLGGRIARGVPIEKSLQSKVAAEARITICDIQFLGVARTGFQTDPFQHGLGTDTINLIYLAHTDDDPVLDTSHTAQQFLSLEELQAKFDELHPYVQYIVRLLLEALN